MKLENADRMAFEKLTGGAAVGAAVVVWFTHGKEFSIEEIAALSVGLGSAITYVVGMIERALGTARGKDLVDKPIVDDGDYS